jgi:hypothetical protein
MEFTYLAPVYHLPRKSRAGQCRAETIQRQEAISKVIVTFSLLILLRSKGFSYVPVMLGPPQLFQNPQTS